MAQPDVTAVTRFVAVTVVLVVAVIGAALPGVGRGQIEVLAAATTDGARLVAISPLRLSDSRRGEAPWETAPQGRTHALNVAAGIDRAARQAGVSPDLVLGGYVNVTVVGSTQPGYASVHPSADSVPEASTINFLAADVIANAVFTRFERRTLQITLTTPAGPGTVEVIVDLLGLLVRTDGSTTGGGLVPISPRRALDTRTTAGPIRAGVDVVVELGSSEPVLVNLTLVNDLPGSRETFVAPLDHSGQSLADVSLVNARSGVVRANSALLVPDSAGRITLRHAFGEAHLLVDVLAQVTTDREIGGTVILLDTPFRVIDSRPEGHGPGEAVPWDLTSFVEVWRERSSIDPDRQVLAVVGNLTATNLRRRVPVVPVSTYLTVHNDLMRLPPTSSINLEEGRDLANGGVFALADGGLVVYNHDGFVDYVLDVTAVLVDS